MQETRRELARRHVLSGREIVQRQRDLIERLRHGSADTAVAEDLLRAFKKSLAVFENDLARIEQQSEKR